MCATRLAVYLRNALHSANFAHNKAHTVQHRHGISSLFVVNFANHVGWPVDHPPPPPPPAPPSHEQPNGRLSCGFPPTFSKRIALYQGTTCSHSRKSLFSDRCGIGQVGRYLSDSSEYRQLGNDANIGVVPTTGRQPPPRAAHISTLATCQPLSSCQGTSPIQYPRGHTHSSIPGRASSICGAA